MEIKPNNIPVEVEPVKKLKTANLKVYMRNYYDSIKEDVLKKERCRKCGGIYSKTNKNKHIKTKKHAFYNLTDFEYKDT